MRMEREAFGGYTVEGGSWVHLVFPPSFRGRNAYLVGALSFLGFPLSALHCGKISGTESVPSSLLLSFSFSFRSLLSDGFLSSFFVIRARIRGGGGELNSEMSRRGAKKKCRCNFFNLAALFCLDVCRAVLRITIWPLGVLRFNADKGPQISAECQCHSLFAFNRLSSASWSTWALSATPLPTTSASASSSPPVASSPTSPWPILGLPGQQESRWPCAQGP